MTFMAFSHSEWILSSVSYRSLAQGALVPSTHMDHLLCEVVFIILWWLELDCMATGCSNLHTWITDRDISLVHRKCVWIFVQCTCALSFQTKTSGVGFVKIHAPWNVLCREAEFMKMKMPTKKVLFVEHPVEDLRESRCMLEYLWYCAFTVDVWGQAEQRRDGEDQHFHLQTDGSSSSKRWGEQDTQREAPLVPLLQRKATFVSVFTLKSHSFTS